MIHMGDVANVALTLLTFYAMICDARSSFLCMLVSLPLLMSTIKLYSCIPSKICTIVSFTPYTQRSIKLELYLSYNNKI
jgi:hypothetical protein